MALQRAGNEGERIAAALRERILKGELKPGQRIRQEAVAERFDSSRMPVRAALQQLAAEQLVVLEPRVGARVAELDAEEFIRIYRLRESLEPLVARVSAERITDAQIARVLALAEELHAVTGIPERLDEFHRVDRAFHLATYAGADFPGYLDRIEQLSNRAQCYRFAIVPGFLESDFTATIADHQLICSYLAERDGEGLGEMVRLHIRRTRRIAERSPWLHEPRPAGLRGRRY
ncbi:GntR family transcriptional regulator [Gulosibacter sp. 10]|uniref:GntR family transcriptional regulator n=1 Tax=Gulosibacter sp. 10 TaxID=1255570 RepID=UPI00097EA88A|nr:GntR family transcriptional regulator [Gulosibacter sp. 10]SJM71081.1 Transcriptional regulator, GntR family [Gulosibacter sp. 10]